MILDQCELDLMIDADSNAVSSLEKNIICCRQKRAISIDIDLGNTF